MQNSKAPDKNPDEFSRRSRIVLTMAIIVAVLAIIVLAAVQHS